MTEEPIDSLSTDKRQDDLIGQIVGGRYKILSLIGKGADGARI